MPTNTKVLAWVRNNQRAYIMRDFYTFAHDSGICWSITEDPYREVCDYLESLLPNTPRIQAWRKEHGRSAAQRPPSGLLRAFFLMPRLTFKTALISALCVFATIIDPDIRIVLGRATTGDAEATLNGIRSTIEQNPVLLAAFGDMRARYDKWTDEFITLAGRKPGMREPTLDTTGLNSSKTGSHPDMAILDDLVHENNYTSAIEMEKAWTKIQAFNPIVERWGTILVQGTRWGDNDVYGRVLDDEERRVQAGLPEQWQKLIWGAYTEGEGEEDRRIRFPHVLPAARLDDLRENTDPKLFAAWYLNEARAAGEDIFAVAYIQPFDGEFVGGPYPTLQLDDTDINTTWRKRFGTEFSVASVMLIDPAPTVGPKSDFTGIVVVAFDTERNWWVCEGQEVKMLPSRRLDHIIYLATIYTPSILALENADLDGVLLQERLAARGLTTTVVSFNPRLDRKKITADPKLAPRGRTSKESQIERMEPTLRGKRMFFRRGATAAVVRQITKYPYLTHDDVIDALSMGQAYEVSAQTYIDRDPLRVFGEIEKREFALEGLNFDGSEVDEERPRRRLPNRRAG